MQFNYYRILGQQTSPNEIIKTFGEMKKRAKNHISHNLT